MINLFEKPVLMIHEVRPWMLNLPLENYVLTFDDGLYSQYFYLDHFLKLKTEKIFFISTNIVCPEDFEQSTVFPTCKEAHETFFSKGNPQHYMKWSQIKKIYKSSLCSIGGHSHFHNHYEGVGIKDLYECLMKDTTLMIESFKKQGIDIEDFCLPYNREHFIYREILAKNGMKRVFGQERIAIESLQQA